MSRIPLKDRFHDTYTPEPMSGCWLWLYKIDRDGYGRMRTGKGEIGAHRWSYALFIGQPPEEVKVLHRCDTPSCVNPNHLFLGTQTDNLLDAVRKGRHDRVICGMRLSPEQKTAISLSTQSRNVTARQFQRIASDGTKDLEVNAAGAGALSRTKPIPRWPIRPRVPRPAAIRV